MLSNSLTLHSLLQKRSEELPDSICLLSTDGSVISYRQLFGYVKHIQQSLRRNNISVNHRVALLLEQGLESAILTLGVMTGATCLPINPKSSFAEIETLLKRSDVKLLYLSRGLFSIYKEHIDSMGVECIIVDEQFFTLSHTSDEGPEFGTILPESDSLALILHTSGSTGTPKSVGLSHYQLLSSAENMANSLGLNASDRALSVMPNFHVGAIVDLILAPIVSKGSVIIAEDAMPETFWSLLSRHSPTWYQGVPTMLKALLRAGSDSHLIESHTLKFIRAVSSSLGEQLADELNRAFNIPIIQIYGMTETAGVITSNSLDHQEVGSVGKPVGLTVSIKKGHQQLAAGEVGEVCVQGASVISHYLSDLLDEQDTTESDKAFDGGWFRTGDLGYLSTSGYLFLVGRIKDQINRGGEKISPIEIDLCAESFEGVQEAAAFSIPHEGLGETVALACVVDDRECFDRNALEAYLKQNLSEHKLPQRIMIVESLPRAAGGKLQRARLSLPCISQDLEEAESIDSSERLNSYPVDRSALSEVEKAILDNWKKLLEVEQVFVSSHFFEMGGDSLSAASLMSAIEKEFSLKLPTYELQDYPRFQDLANRVNEINEEALILNTKHQQAKANKVSLGSFFKKGNQEREVFHVLRKIIEGWGGQRLRDDSLLVGYNLEGDKPPLFWVCQSVREVSNLVSALGPSQPIYFMRSLYKVQRRINRNMPKLANVYFNEIKGIQPEGPIYLGGFSEGARVAAYISEQIIDAGMNVGLLAVYDTLLDRPVDVRSAVFHCPAGLGSPFGVYSLPEYALGNIYRGKTSLYRYDWAHEDGLNIENSPMFARDLAYELEFAMGGGDSSNLFSPPQTVVPKVEDYKRYIHVKLPRSIDFSSPCTARVSLKNTSDKCWQATRTTGVALMARWLSVDGSRRGIEAGFCEILNVVEAGQELRMDMSLNPPQSSGVKILEIDLQLIGHCWMSDSGKAVYRKWIRVAK